MSKDFEIFRGKFICQRCEEEVGTLRLWFNTLDLTWQCSNKHVSKVNIAKKRRVFSDREE
jgi:hypothetical protein